ncbi:MAG: hypothetical protein JWO80_2708 [Bryobacterales bacterium]|jgi:hypothetical protein|nr:hypothetical protein [Bryobacterales bacterium]
MTRYLPARHYISFGIVALGLAVFSGWLGMEWHGAFFPAGLFLLSAALLLFLAVRPAVEVQEAYLAIGKRLIPWMDIRRLDRTGWLSPLIVRLTLYDDTRITLVYPGDLEACKSLLRTLRRMCRDSLIDGIPYRQYWGEVLASSGERKLLPAPRYRLLLPEDEAEVERLYQRLKAVGHIDPKSTDE